jgi:glyoxylase-like metal-dependent hydrolase (beta-lactamase superfamily II)
MSEPTSVRPSGLKPVVEAFFDKRTCSVQYLVSDPETRRCAIIDPVLDFEPKSGATGTQSADAVLEHIRSERLVLDWVLDTHPHADHFSAGGYLKDKTGARTAIGQKVVEVQGLWKDLYNLPDSFRTDGSQWDKLFSDGERFNIGNLTCEVLFSPGHTLASITYVVSDAAFIHDTLFMPDGGTARCDFPGGSAKALWHTIQRILALPDDTRLFTGARLHAERSRTAMGEHSRAAEGREHPPADRRAVRHDEDAPLEPKSAINGAKAPPSANSNDEPLPSATPENKARRPENHVQ